MQDWKSYINGLGTYAQTNSKWANEDYYGDNLTGKDNTFGHLGCSLTSLTNILVWATRGVNAPNPHDANLRNEKFLQAMEKVYFKCLKTGRKLRLGGNNGNDNNLIYSGGTFDAPVDMKSIQYTYILNKTRTALGHGHPVLLSYCNCNDQAGDFSHSVVAMGVYKDDHICIYEVYGYQNAEIFRLKECINVTPCRTLYKAYECIRI